jgi:DNA-binding PadR family transcriptional regulator
MTADSLDPVIRAPARLRIVATLAALPDGASLSFTRLQDMLEMTPDTLITHLRKLEDTGCLESETTGNGGARATIALTRQGREALDRYAAMLRHLLAAPARHHRMPPAPGIRVGDADRDAAAAVLGEHFAQGRLTLDELNTRLGAALAATTHGELSQATGDLPEVTVVSARVSVARGKRGRPGHQPGLVPGPGPLPRRRGRAPGGSS